MAVKVRETTRKPRPTKVIERVETRFEEPDAWSSEPWSEAQRKDTKPAGDAKDKRDAR